MQRIIIPPITFTPAARRCGPKTAPASIWRRHLDAGTRQGVYPRLSVMQGRSAISAMPMKPAPSR